ncbi:hypothetical protein K461DRAFT_270293 [Myriangium duriaei CBS 260.36]|uniref:Uncharacterized protein n=1 Tax=Myriangium duriaei CBS 260.36 TaxID=1168546 RepID=A0A9P4IVW0_9PEZI|nr:hypothetical protein K461DRAFT_270293 [Myriangium duriaei CBS 260.36]
MSQQGIVSRAWYQYAIGHVWGTYNESAYTNLPECRRQSFADMVWELPVTSKTPGAAMKLSFPNVQRIEFCEDPSGLVDAWASEIWNARICSFLELYGSRLSHISFGSFPQDVDSDELVTLLDGCKELREVVLEQDCEVPDDVLIHLADHKELKKLNMWGGIITADLACKVLELTERPFADVEELLVGVDDPGALACLSRGSTKLKDLIVNVFGEDFCECRGLAFLSAMEALEMLEFTFEDNSEIKEDFLHELQLLPRLRQLRISAEGYLNVPSWTDGRCHLAVRMRKKGKGKGKTGYFVPAVEWNGYAVTMVHGREISIPLPRLNTRTR